ncbi:MAG: recombinase family protein [Candidatus Pacebacteria bacterium]|nr:recombinase family protein [Candidatus Paceibacterota bacterium]
MNIKPKYFLYARKSTEDDDKQIMSIESQLHELREFARKENLEILEEFQESKSAKTPGRAIFGEMMEKIEDIGNVGILAWHPDRLARNSIDGGRIIYAVDQKNIVSLRFPTFWFEPTPQGLFMLQVAFGQSKYYSDNLSENVKRGVRAKVRRGEWLTKAPFGYINDRSSRNIKPHPIRSRIIMRAYEEYTKGTHGLVSLADFLALHGVVTKKGAPLGKASIKRILTNRAYLGFVKHRDEWFEGSFAPIISPKLFESVQKVLKDRERPRKRKASHDFPFVGLFRCGECASMITAQWATGRHGGRYRYYRCTKKKGKCSQKYLREDILVFQLQERLQTISLCDESIDYMLKKVEQLEKDESSSSQSRVQNLADRIKVSEVRLEKLVSTYLDGDVPKDIYLKKKDVLMRTTLTLKEKKKDFEHKGNNWVEPLREWILDTKQANFLSSSIDFKEISSFVKKIGTNPTVLDKSARFGTSVLSEFVCAYRTETDFAHPLLPTANVKNLRDVTNFSFCELLVAFGRTLFEQKTD